ncbi:MAG TPA: sulfotransferase [Steroidobacteraceae bacterium]|nr:sulfotransferase [Steroidobacteraceae bacterium]
MPLKLIGAGLGRTGTVSLKLALERLGIGPCYHMTELFMHLDHAPEWVKAADGKPDWERLFAGYSSTVDFPGCTFWRELTHQYPTAKVLLSVRDPDEWFDSTQATIFSDASTVTLQASPLREFFEKTVWQEFRDRIHDRGFMVEAFRRHNTEVERSIPPERLLVYQIGQGWEPVCEFLGVPVPDLPFPRANTREEYVARHARRATPGVENWGDEIRSALNKQRPPG